jgi:hypothetical protein
MNQLPAQRIGPMANLRPITVATWSSLEPVDEWVYGSKGLRGFPPEGDHEA